MNGKVYDVLYKSAFDGWLVITPRRETDDCS